MGLLVNHLFLSPQQTVGDRVAEFPYTNAAKRLLHKTSDQAAKIKQMTSNNHLLKSAWQMNKNIEGGVKTNFGSMPKYTSTRLYDIFWKAT